MRPADLVAGRAGFGSRGAIASGSYPNTGAFTDTAVSVSARTSSTGVVFELGGPAPSGVSKATLWYDTAVGRRGRHFRVEPGKSLDRSVGVSLVAEGLEVSMPFGGRLDYWWALQGNNGLVERRSGSILLPPALRALARPPSSPVDQNFKWAEATSPHFRLRFYPGSAAERDIEAIKIEAEQALVRASAIISPTEPVSITTYLVPRVFWQGGVAYNGSTLMMSYGDRNYAGVDLPLYLLHESIHALAHGLVAEDGDVGGLIGEGTAVYATGGHYRDAPIDSWTAALRASDRFVPLCRLRATFFEQQHEIAYLEGASFVGYLIRTYGLPAFRTFYAEEPAIPDAARSDVETWCAGEATRMVAGIPRTYAELEQEWLRYLDTVDPTAAESAGFWGQIRFFDLMRTYQEQRDPSARILPSPPARWRNDVLRAFATPALTETNTIYESMFVGADRALDAGDPETANVLMDELDIAVDSGVFTGTLGRDYAAIASVLRRNARAVRLGDPAALRMTTMPHIMMPVDQLWTEYRLALNSLEVDGTRAIARVERVSRGLGGHIRREGLVVTLERRPISWRIASFRADSERPPMDSTAPMPTRRGHMTG